MTPDTHGASVASDRPPPGIGVGSAVGTALLCGLGATWRLERAPGYDARDRALRDGEPALLVFWHQRLLTLAWTHRRRGIAVLVSRHRDGEWIARVLERLGCVTGRGSSTRDGSAGLRALVRHSREGRTLAVTPDGPRGPAGRVKPGVIAAAALTGLPLVPLTAVADRSWAVNSWDRLRVPWPFARVRLSYGEPLRVPRGLDEAGTETWRLRVEAAIHANDAAAAAAVGERPVAPRRTRAPETGGADAERAPREGAA